MNYEAVIGLEIHAELKTNSKMFCRCKNDPFHSEPNTNICPICIGLPGTLPAMNKRALEWVIMAGLATGCQINRFSKWDRKNYFYPDLPKGYQISQYDLPLCYKGHLEIEGKKIGITRIHLEEDTGKLLHPKGEDYSLVDYNRSSVPLMELVTEPDIRSGKEAAGFAQELQLILRSLGISKANMEKGEMRVEVNISIRPEGTEKFGTKVEVKNLNSFMAVEKSVDFEIKRQIDCLERGEKIVQETRGWNEDKRMTFSQREKETAMDYRYFPEPDLPPVELSEEWIDNLKKDLPELPRDKRERYELLDIGSHYAEILASTRAGEYFDSLVGKYKNLPAKNAANWLIQENFNFEIPVDFFAEFLKIIEDKEISVTMGKEVIREMNETLESPRAIIEKKGMKQIGGGDELVDFAKQVIENNKQAITDYKSGKENAMGYLVGQLMKVSRGQANPEAAKETLKKLIK